MSAPTPNCLRQPPSPTLYSSVVAVVAVVRLVKALASCSAQRCQMCRQQLLLIDATNCKYIAASVRRMNIEECRCNKMA